MVRKRKARQGAQAVELALLLPYLFSGQSGCTLWFSTGKSKPGLESAR